VLAAGAVGAVALVAEAIRPERAEAANGDALTVGSSSNVASSPTGLEVTGEVASTEEDFFGHAVNYAARVAGVAKGGEILVSAVVHDLVAPTGLFTFAETPRGRLEGHSGRIAALRTVPAEPSDHCLDRRPAGTAHGLASGAAVAGERRVRSSRTPSTWSVRCRAAAGMATLWPLSLPNGVRAGPPDQAKPG
jgi:hypothetical protein